MRGSWEGRVSGTNKQVGTDGSPCSCSSSILLGDRDGAAVTLLVRLLLLGFFMPSIYFLFYLHNVIT